MLRTKAPAVRPARKSWLNTSLRRAGLTPPDAKAEGGAETACRGFMTTITADEAGPPAGALTLLMLGNVAIGAGVLAPAAMINTLTEAFAVGPPAIGALIGWGAVILCLGAPSLGFFTRTIDRRALLTACLLVYVLGHAASAFAADYGALLGVRLAMIAAAAVYTPQAAGTVALLVAPHRRAGAVAFVFLGWSLAVAMALPVMAFAGEAVGWRAVYLGLALLSALAAAGVAVRTPAALRPQPMELKDWRDAALTPAIAVLLAATALQVAGQFVLFPYIAAELRRASGADPGQVAIVLALNGFAGLIGAVAAARLAGPLGPARVHLICLASLAAGLIGWSLFAGALLGATIAVALWGLGFGAAISMQQARLIAAAPTLASASVAFNTSVLYAGQALGAAAGGALLSAGAAHLLGPAGALCMAAAGLVSWLALRRFRV